MVLAWCIVEFVDRLHSMYDFRLMNFFVNDGLNLFVHVVDSTFTDNVWNVRRSVLRFVRDY